MTANAARSTTVVSIRLAPADMALLRAVAERRGVTLSEAARTAIGGALHGAGTVHAGPLQATNASGGSLTLVVPLGGPMAFTVGPRCRAWEHDR